MCSSWFVVHTFDSVITQLIPLNLTFCGHTSTQQRQQQQQQQNQQQEEQSDESILTEHGNKQRTQDAVAYALFNA